MKEFALCRTAPSCPGCWEEKYCHCPSYLAGICPGRFQLSKASFALDPPHSPLPSPPRLHDLEALQTNAFSGFLLPTYSHSGGISRLGPARDSAVPHLPPQAAGQRGSGTFKLRDSTDPGTTAPPPQPQLAEEGVRATSMSFMLYRGGRSGVRPGLCPPLPQAG